MGNLGVWEVKPWSWMCTKKDEKEEVKGSMKKQSGSW